MRKINKKKQLIYTYIEENIKEIIIISLIFIIGVVFGILLINNVQDEGKEEIITYGRKQPHISDIRQNADAEGQRRLVEAARRDDLVYRLERLRQKYDSHCLGARTS